MESLENSLGRVSNIYSSIKNAYDMINEEYESSESDKVNGIRDLALDKLDEAGALVKLLGIVELGDTLIEDDIKLLVEAYAIHSNVGELLDDVDYLKECVDGYAEELGELEEPDGDTDKTDGENQEGMGVTRTKCEFYMGDSDFGCADCSERDNCPKQLELSDMYNPEQGLLDPETEEDLDKFEKELEDLASEFDEIDEYISENCTDDESDSGDDELDDSEEDEPVADGIDPATGEKLMVEVLYDVPKEHSVKDEPDGSEEDNAGEACHTCECVCDDCFEDEIGGIEDECDMCPEHGSLCDGEGCHEGVSGNPQRGLEIINCALQSDDVEYKRYILDIMKNTINDMVDSGKAAEICGESGIDRAKGLSKAIDEYMDGKTSSEELENVVTDYLKSDRDVSDSLGIAVDSSENSSLYAVVCDFIDLVVNDRDEHAVFSDEIINILMGMLWEKTNDIEKFVRNIENDDCATVDNDSIELKRSFDDTMLRGNEVFKVEVFNSIVSMETNNASKEETANRIISALNDALDVIYPNENRGGASNKYDKAEGDGDGSDVTEDEESEEHTEGFEADMSEVADSSGDTCDEVDTISNDALDTDTSENDVTTEDKLGNSEPAKEIESETDVVFAKMWDLYTLNDNRSGLSKLFHSKKKKAIKKAGTTDLERALLNEVNHTGILRTQGGSKIEFEYSRSTGVTLLETSYLSEVDYARFNGIDFVSDGSVRAFSDFELRHRFENNVNYKSLGRFLCTLEPLLKVGTITVGNLVFA